MLRTNDWKAFETVTMLFVSKPHCDLLGYISRGKQTFRSLIPYQLCVLLCKTSQSLTAMSEKIRKLKSARIYKINIYATGSQFVYFVYFGFGGYKCSFRSMASHALMVFRYKRDVHFVQFALLQICRVGLSTFTFNLLSILRSSPFMSW